MMEGVRQRRHVADVVISGDASQVATEKDKDTHLLPPQSSSVNHKSLSSDSSKLLTERSTISAVSANNKQLLSAEVEKSIEQLDALGKLERPSDEETLWLIGLEVFLPFVVAGLGMATTGITLNHVKVSAEIHLYLAALFII